MIGLVYGAHSKGVPGKLDLIDRARILPEAPIAGKRQPQHMQQYYPVDAVMPDQHDRIAWMTADHIAQRSDRPVQHLLQGFAARNRGPVRRTIPTVDHLGPAASGLVRRESLPLAVIDVDQPVARDRDQTERLANCSSGRQAPAEWTGIDRDRRTGRMNAPRSLPPAGGPQRSTSDRRGRETVRAICLRHAHDAPE